MANLSLRHNGNMNITSASIGSGGTLNVQYGQNTTGNITGWTHNQSDPLVCGETYTITLLPQFSGTVLSENFVVSGVDEAGVPRSDTSVLRQGFDSNLLHYDVDPRNNLNRIQINSSSATETYLEVNATVVGHSSDTVGFWIYHYLPGEPQSKSNFVRFNVVDPVGPDTGTSITAITIVVDDFVTDNGWAGVEYAPEDASTSFVYSSSDTSKATIDPNTGEITILESGYVTFCVRDTVSGLEDCKQIYGIKTHPDTGVTAITAISISVAETIIEQGYAYAFYSPNDVEVNLAFSSSDPTVASIDPDTGEITVYQDGYVTFCVTDSISGLQDCKGSYVKKAVYINDISIIVNDKIVLVGTATCEYNPTAGTVNLVYSSSNPEMASIDPVTGVINVYQKGYVTFCVRDTYTNISDCKTVEVDDLSGLAQFTYNVTSTSNATLLFSNNECCGDHWSDFSKAIYYNGAEITPNQKSYVFPETGEQTIYVDFKTYYGENGYYNLNNCIFNGNSSLVKAKFPEDYPAQGTGNYLFINCVNLREADMSCFKELDYACFYGCTSLTSLTIPNVELIGSASLAHSGLQHLYGPKVKTVYGESLASSQIRTVDFPVLERLNSWCFCGSTLENITLPPSFATLEGRVFEYCNSLRFITFEGTIPPSMENTSFIYTNLSAIIVPCGSKDAYIEALPTAALDSLVVCPDDMITSITISLPSTIVDYATASTTYSPANNTVRLTYSSSDKGVAEVDNSGVVTVFRNGTTTITVMDLLTSIEDSVTVNCQSTNEKRLVVAYDVTSTTSPTQISTTTNLSQYFSRAMLEDGTNVPIGGTGYTFSNTGRQKVCYIVSQPTIVNPPFNISNVVSVSLPKNIEVFSWDALSGTSISEIYSYSFTPPYTNSNLFAGWPHTNGVLYYPSGANYSRWLNDLEGRGWTGSPTL
jgi:uncharacterized protein YjdB